MESESFDRLAAALDGRYRLDRVVGRGGMASVYLAEDLRHDRKVALKVLLPELAARIGRERFLAEIKTTARLQHPHLLPLLDSGEADGLLYFVMPYVEGQSLAARLETERQLPIDEAVRIAKGVAGALDFAHRHGVIHRDVKPSNILLHDGEPMVTDFGIARALSSAGGERLTETGFAVGTPHYMSPEQLTGDMEVGPRSDVYALGCVLYEMVAGRPPFEASTVTALAGRVLTADPRPPSEDRPSLPPNVEATALKALEKIPADRFDSPAAFAAALDDEAFRHAHGRPAVAAGSTSSAPATGLHPGYWLALAVVAVLSLGLGIAVAGGSGEEGVAAPSTSVPLEAERWGDLSVLSDDGRLAAGRPSQDGPIRINRLDGGPSTEVPVEADVYPIAFSPDSEWLLIGGAGGLRRVPVDGGRPVLVAENYATSAAWSENGLIAFVGLEGIYTVPWESGTPTRVLDEGGYLTVGRLDFLPDGRHLLFTRAALGSSPGREVLVLDVETGTVQSVVEDGISGEFLPPDLLLFVRPERGLFAAAFDPETRSVQGQPVPVLDSVVAADLGAAYAVSHAGTLVALVGTQPPDNLDGAHLAVADTLGRVDTLSIVAAAPSMFAVSPDGGRITLPTPRGEGLVLDRATGATVAIPNDGLFFAATWHPSGDTVTAFQARPDGSFSLVAIPVQDGGDARQLAEPGPGLLLPLDWSEDGRSILVQTGDATGQDFDLEILDAVTGERRPYLTADWGEVLGAISPGGEWVAYVSSESERIELRAFPEPGAAFDISQAEVHMQIVTRPRWAPDGRGVYWQDSEGIMFTPLTLDPEVEVGTPRRVLEGSFMPFFDVERDGRLLVALPNAGGRTRDVGSRRVLLLVNWLDRLRDAVAVER